jgi:hypothetical protein
MSFVPITNTVARSDASAMSLASRIARGVSSIAQILTESGAPPASSCFSTAATSSTELTFGTTTAAGAACATARRSSAPHAVSRPLTRMVTSRSP